MVEGIFLPDLISRAKICETLAERRILKKSTRHAKPSKTCETLLDSAVNHSDGPRPPTPPNPPETAPPGILGDLAPEIGGPQDFRGGRAPGAPRNFGLPPSGAAIGEGGLFPEQFRDTS